MKKICIVLSMCMMFMLGACCVQEVGAEQNRSIKIWFENTNGEYSTFDVVDERTGVNYIVVGYEGFHGGGVAITPRLNADGALYVTGGK